ncbi:LysR family transcriptional regulator [Paenibacillus sp. FSL R10-2782]|uniref:LysR family transcriptional regulator n=1 Tax=Paenibacillus sp. FSL R10-2782 TaxID=2954661 RepID=UPI00315897FC
MVNNYKYFLVLSEELNISSAAKRLFISHQCLSKYIKGLEARYGVSFFERKPKFALTPAGKTMLDTLRQIELSEQNLENQLADIKDAKSGTIHFGITEGRYPIIVPKLLKEFHNLHPKVKLNIHRTTSPQMQEMVLNNSLDLFLSGVSNLVSHNLKYEIVVNERMYIVISDNLLKQYFPNDYPQCKETFAKGADLRLFQQIPFVLNKENFNSRILLDKHLSELGVSLNCINELTQPDIHYLLCAEDYAASFCLTMYLSGINQLNQFKNGYSHLNVFPIANFTSVNPLALIYHKNKKFPSYIQDLKNIIKRLCSPYSTPIE